MTKLTCTVPIAASSPTPASGPVTCELQQSAPHVASLVDLATIVSPMLAMVVGLLTLAVLREQMRRSEALALQLKRADVVQSFNNRYDKLWDLRQAPASVADPLVYHLRFWSLQLDQFIQWQDRLVADEDFITWMKQRCRDFRREPNEFKGLDFRTGWRQAKTEIEAPAAFVQLIDRLAASDGEIEAVVRQAVRQTPRHRQ